MNLNKYVGFITSLSSIEVCKIRLYDFYLQSYFGHNRLQCEANVVPARWYCFSHLQYCTVVPTLYCCIVHCFLLWSAVPGS